MIDTKFEMETHQSSSTNRNTNKLKRTDGVINKNLRLSLVKDPTPTKAVTH